MKGFKEFIRKLTANYTEEEYDAWLYEELCKPVKTEPKFTSMKDLACALSETAADTGYDYEFLVERFNEQLFDGNTVDEAFAFVHGVSVEQDW